MTKVLEENWKRIVYPNYRDLEADFKINHKEFGLQDMNTFSMLSKAQQLAFARWMEKKQKKVKTSRIEGIITKGKYKGKKIVVVFGDKIFNTFIFVNGKQLDNVTKMTIVGDPNAKGPKVVKIKLEMLEL